MQWGGRGSIALAFLVVAGGLSLAPPGPAVSADANADVEVGNLYFSPKQVEIDPGDSVTWHFVEGTHSVVASDGSGQWCSTRSAGADDCTRSFTEVGTYDYYCGVHPSSMQGTVKVNGIDPVITIASPLPDEKVEGTFTASGDATHPDGITAVAWRLDGGSFAPVDTFVPTSEGADWATDVDTTSLPNGVRVLEVRATGGDGESATASVSFIVDNPGEVDLLITSFKTTDGITSARLQASVKNDGNIKQEAALAFEYANHGTWDEIGRYTLTIGPGQTFTRILDWDADGKIGGFDVRVRADPDEVVDEPDETNNAAHDRAGFGHSLLPGLDPREPV